MVFFHPRSPTNQDTLCKSRSFPASDFSLRGPQCLAMGREAKTEAFCAVFGLCRAIRGDSNPPSKPDDQGNRPKSEFGPPHRPRGSISEIEAPPDRTHAPRLLRIHAGPKIRKGTRHTHGRQRYRRLPQFFRHFGRFRKLCRILYKVRQKRVSRGPREKYKATKILRHLPLTDCRHACKLEG